MSKSYKSFLQELEVSYVKDCFNINGKDDALIYATLVPNELSAFLVGVNECHLRANHNRLSELSFDKIRSIQMFVIDKEYNLSFVSVSNKGNVIHDNKTELMSDKLLYVGDHGEKLIYVGETKPQEDSVPPMYYYPSNLNMSARPALNTFLEKIIDATLDEKNDVIKNSFDREIMPLISDYYSLEQIKDGQMRIERVGDKAVVFRFFQVKKDLLGNEVFGEISRIILDLEKNKVGTYARYSYNKWSVLTNRSGSQVDENKNTHFDENELDKLEGTRLEFLRRHYRKYLKESYDNKSMNRIFFNLMRFPLLLSMFEMGFIKEFNNVIRLERDFMNKIKSINPMIKKELPYFNHKANTLIEASGLSPRQFNDLLEVIPLSQIGITSKIMSYIGKPSSLDPETTQKMIDLSTTHFVRDDKDMHPIDYMFGFLSKELRYETFRGIVDTVYEWYEKEKEDLVPYNWRHISQYMIDIVEMSKELDLPLELKFDGVESMTEHHDIIVEEYYHQYGIDVNDINRINNGGVINEKRRQQLINESNNTLEKYSKMKEKYSYLEYENEDFKIILPENRLDLLREGMKLSHCVSGYHNRYINGTEIVLFVRRKDNLEAPFYTVSITNEKHFVQCMTRFNESYIDNKPMKEFVDEWRTVKNIR